MVDGVSFNPFTQKAFTDEEILKLDTDKDGKISQSEYKAGESWLASISGADVDGALDETSNLSDDANKIFDESKKDGVKDKAQNSAELKDFMKIVTDEFVENYIQKNPEMSAADKSTIIAFIQLKAGEFLTKLIEGNAEGPFDMKSIVGQFTESIDKAITDRKTKMTSVNNMIDGYKKNDGNFDKLANDAAVASSDFVTDAEYNKLKNDAVKFLMGELLKGNEEPDLLKSIASTFNQSSNYKNALNLIKSIATESDPDKIQKMIEDATKMLTELVGSVGKDKLVNAITDTKHSAAEKELEATLIKLADSYIEAEIASRPNMSQEETDALKALVKGCVGKYIAECAEKFPQIDKMDVTNLVQDFGAYVDAQRAKMTQTKAAMNQMGGESTQVYNSLMSAYDSATSDKFVSEQERQNLIKAGADFVLNQMMNDAAGIALLKAINPSYTSNADYKNALSLINKMKSETDPDKLQKMMDEAKASIKKLLTDCGQEKLVDGIKSLKPMEVNDTLKTDIVNKSPIASDYTAGASRNSGYGKQNDESLAEIQEQAKKDLEALAVTMKAELKSQMGSQFDEASVDRYINDAMTDTLAQFTQNVSRRTRDSGNYNAKTEDTGFVFLRKKGTKSGRYSYNVRTLADTFIQKFNDTSKLKNAAKIDPNLATYDKENVIASSLGNDYWRNKSEIIEARNDDQKAYAELMDKAKAELKSVGAALKASLKAEGVPLSDFEIDEFIEGAINDTITDMKNAFQYCQPGGKVSGGAIKTAAGGVGGVLTSAAVGAGVGAVTAAATAAGVTGATTLSVLAAGGSVVASGASAGLGSVGLAGAFGLAGPIGWAAGAVVAAGVALKQFTNIFGATYGKHDQNAGFYFERKSNSKDGKWGYDTKTLVDTFMAKIDQKVAEAKEKKKTEATKAV